MKEDDCMFEIKDLKYKDILNIPSLVLDQPIHCIIGVSGCGKTTLLRHLNHLNEADQGEIYYNGISIKEINPIELRRNVVMLNQTPILYDGTIMDNLQIGLYFSQKPEVSKEAMIKILSEVGLNQPLNAYCDKLSGGEKQRLCLARVLLMDADTYLMDEPTSAIDKETENFIVHYLGDYVLKHNKQLILVSHSDQIASMFLSGNVYMNHGEINL